MTVPIRGIAFGKDRRKQAATPDFTHSLAIVIGIDAYTNGVPRLTTAVNDANSLAELLREQLGYEVRVLTEDVTRKRLLGLLREENLVGKGDRMLFYFAGHGIALDGDNGPEGYLIPQDANAADPGSFLPMRELAAALEALPCRHLLAILDCCFAGSFRWAGGTRALPRPPEVIHKERYLRYIQHPAWQVITSAAHDQQALDVLDGKVLGAHGEAGGSADGDARRHSPFARALFDALIGAADQLPDGGDGLLTATELYLYLREAVEPDAKALARHEQTPGLWPLKRHDKGEFVFRVPGKPFDPPSAPALTTEANPYRGLKPYERRHARLFFGRSKSIEELARHVAAHRLTVVLGISGSGKSSLVNAGLVPRLQGRRFDDNASNSDGASADSEPGGNSGEGRCWYCLDPMRPGNDARKALVSHIRLQLPLLPDAELKDEHVDRKRPLEIKEEDAAVEHLLTWCAVTERRILLVIDQPEELITLRKDEAGMGEFLSLLTRLMESAADRLHVVMTTRSDFELQILSRWQTLRKGSPDLVAPWTEEQRFELNRMTSEELREAVESPAAEKVLFFDPPSLPQRLVDDVRDASAPLPMLSFVLSALYLAYLENDAADRTLSGEVYVSLGGVRGALRKRANTLFERFDEVHRKTLRRVMLRMVAFDGGELTRRRVPKTELDYPDAEENRRVKDVIDKLDDARLIVGGTDLSAHESEQAYWEPAHDELISSWVRLQEWAALEADTLPLQRRITAASREWDRQEEEKYRKRLLWNKKPHRAHAERLLAAQGSELPDVKATAVPEAGKAPSPSAVKAMSTRILRLWRVMSTRVEVPTRDTVLNRLETEFVAASFRYRRHRLWTNVLASVLVLLVAGGAYGWVSWERSVGEQARRAEAARRHAEEAQKLAPRYPEQALLVAAEEAATVGTRLGIVESTLREILGTMGGVRLGKNPYEYAALDFDPKGRWLAWSCDGTEVCLQDLAKPLETPRRLHHSDLVDALAIGPNGRWLAALSEGSAPRLWDLDDLDAEPRLVAGRGSRADAEQGIAGDASERLEGADALAFSPSGDMLALAFPKRVELWRLPSSLPAAGTDVASEPELAQELPRRQARAKQLAFSADGRRLALRSDSNEALVWDLLHPDAGPEELPGVEDEVAALAFDPKGRWLATGCRDSDRNQWGLCLWRFEDSAIALTARYSVFERALASIAFDGRGTRLVAGSESGEIKLWSLDDSDYGPANPPKVSPRTLSGHSGEVLALGFDSTGQWIASGSEDRLLRIWDLDSGSGQVGHALRGHEDRLSALAFDPEGRWIATGAADGSTRLWPMSMADSEPMVVRAEYPGNRLIPADAKVSPAPPALAPDAHWIASGGTGGPVRLYDLEQPAEKHKLLNGDERSVTAFAFSAEGRLLAASWGDQRVRVWDPERLDNPPAVLEWHKEPVVALAFDRSGRWLASSGFDGATCVWDLAADVPACEQLSAPVKNLDVWGQDGLLAVGPRGKLVAGERSTGELYLWRRDKPGVATSVLLDDSKAGFERFCLDPDGRWLAVSSGLGELRLWDLREKTPTPRLLRTSEPDDTRRSRNTGTVDLVVVDAGGRQLAGVGRDGTTVWLWEPGRPDQLPVPFHGHEEGVTAAVFGPAGRWLAVASNDNRVRLWDTADPEAEAITLSGTEHAVVALAFSRDRQRLVGVDRQGTALIWQFQVEPLIKTACRFAGRNLSFAEWSRHFGARPYCRVCPQFAPDGFALCGER